MRIAPPFLPLWSPSSRSNGDLWENHPLIDWEVTTAQDHGQGQGLLVKEALHIQMTPSAERFNGDEGLEVPGCWIAVMRRQGGAILTDLRPPMTWLLSIPWL